MKLGICSPFIGFNPSSTKEDPLLQVLPLHLTEKLKMAMKEFDSFPHGVIAMPPYHEPLTEKLKMAMKEFDSFPDHHSFPDHEPFIAKSNNPYETMNNSKKRKAKSQELEETKNNPKKKTEKLSELAGFYAEDLLYGTVLAEVKKLYDSSDEQAFIMKGYMSSTFIKHLPVKPTATEKLLNIEVDTLIVLPLRKLLIVIETKAATEDTSFPSKLKEGSQQCEKFHQFLKAAHWNILSKQWKLVKCVSLPIIFNLEEDKNQEKIKQNCRCCQNCEEFIIDGRKEWIIGWRTML